MAKNLPISSITPIRATIFTTSTAASTPLSPRATSTPTISSSPAAAAAASSPAGPSSTPIVSAPRLPSTLSSIGSALPSPPIFHSSRSTGSRVFLGPPPTITRSPLSPISSPNSNPPHYPFPPQPHIPPPSPTP